MRQALLALAFLGLGIDSAQAQGETVPTKKQPPAAAPQPAMKHVFLGVGVEALPPALASQMHGIVPEGQGLLVEQVARNSPAAKAGLKPHDVLLSFGGQKLHSPEELMKLVRADKVGHEVTVGYIRNGKPAACKVALAERESPTQQELQRVFRFRPDERFREMFEEFESKNGNTWDAFEALKLAKVDAKHWRAEIDYRSKDGKKEHKSFEGTRDEIGKAIRAEKDLPANERTHLLRALNLHDPVFEFHFSPFDQLGPAFWEQP